MYHKRRFEGEQMTARTFTRAQLAEISLAVSNGPANPYVSTYDDGRTGPALPFATVLALIEQARGNAR